MDNIEKEIRFQELYTNYNRLVGTYLNKNIKNRTDREDVFQQIWLGIGESVDRIEPGKEHAFIRKVTMNQIHKLYYYSTRDRKWTKRMEAENSEEEEFSLVDIAKEVREQDDFEYLEIMDAIESILTEEEFQIFLAYFQGITKQNIEKAFDLTPNLRRQRFKEINDKLINEFGAKESIFSLPERAKGLKRKPRTEEQRRNISNALKGCHGYNNGKEERQTSKCPEGGVPGRLKLKK